ncbi:hypothetical protein [Hydrogenophaga sp.]|uniref:hypothetical protein n=1 Tax=Hydrogenophaga sp. TaxID=1904254 RepID=UPI002728E863|nr:hypothetical protein [Hydrogenophaga sp.]MDO9438226.1 hypothetical protein [Hydrogenophaga sp.]
MAKALHPFMKQPDTLGVQVFATPTLDATAFADLLRLRSLNWLEIAGSPVPIEWLKAVAGVDTGRLCLAVQQPAVALIDDFVRALVAIVKGSGAWELDMGKAAIDGPTCARVLACCDDQDHVHVRLSPEVVALLSQGQHTVGWLEVQMADETPRAALAFMGMAASPAFIKVLGVCGVRRLVVHGPVDLVQWVGELDRYTAVQRKPMPLEYVDAGFVTRTGVEPEEALVSLERNDEIVAVTPLPLSTSVNGYSPLDAVVVKRLAALRAVHEDAQEQAVLLANENWVRLAATTGPVFAEAVSALAGLLGKESTLGEFVACVRLRFPVVFTPAFTLAPSPDLTQTGLRCKLEFLNDTVLPEGLVKAVIAKRLSLHPQEKKLLLRALIDAQLLYRPLTRDEGRMLGHSLQKEWVLDGGMLDDHFPQVYRKPTARLPAVTGTAVRMPDDPQERWALVSPYTHAGYDALVQTLHVRLGRTRAALAKIPASEPDKKDLCLRAIKAFLLIHELLTIGVLQPTFMTEPVCAQIAIELLVLGQGKLLRHILPAGTNWYVDARAVQNASALAELHPWPEPQRECGLCFTHALVEGSLQRLVDLAGGVAPDKLTLTLLLTDSVDATRRDAVVQVIESRPGLAMQLQASRNERIPLDEWGLVFQRIQKLEIGHVDLTSIWDINESAYPVLIDFVQASRVSNARVVSCDVAFTQKLVACKSWNKLWVTTSRDLANYFMTKAVSAKTLRLTVSGDDAQQCAEDMIGSCRDLERVEIVNTSVNVAALTRGLDKSRSVTSVKIRPAEASDEDEKAAAMLLWRNPWIIDIELLPPVVNGVAQRLPITQVLQQEFEKTAARNLLRDSEAFRMGAGKGFGWSLGDGLELGIGHAPSFVRKAHPFTDIGALMGGMLDVASARALSQTHKAAYRESQAVWQMEIERLGDLIAPSVERVAFVDEVNRRILAWGLGGEPVVLKTNEEKLPITVPQKILILRSAGLHDSVCELVLRRRLTRMLALPDAVVLSGRTRRAVQQDHDSIHSLLEALAYFGDMPAETWLSKVMGVDVQPLPTPTQGHV